MCVRVHACVFLRVPAPVFTQASAETPLNQTVLALILCTKDLQISIVYRQNIKASLCETNLHFL